MIIMKVVGTGNNRSSHVDKRISNEMTGTFGKNA
jgi:hypothetical protein